ncbi:MAG: DUF4382 domain-containing protein [Ignavibacteriae bacterium]|nr:DUF4382 domain-containing protein [Ignavibacteriota bacterium]
MISRMLVSVFVLTVAATWFGCSDDPATPATTGRLKVYLTDAPANAQQVNITFSEIAAHVDGNWVVVRGTPITVNLLEWNNGKTLVIGDAELGPGNYTQIRLIINTANIVIDGQTYPLTVPSGAQTGLKLIHTFDIEAGSTYEMVIDFDAEQSIVVRGPKNDPNSYSLKPTLRVVAKPLTGAISGIVTNPGTATVATALNELNAPVTSSPVDPATGAFTLAFLPPAAYTVRVEDTSAGSASKPLIIVTPGSTTNAGAFTLSK